ncbi:nuclear speckle splicing regulatory protein 1-like isoform X3 [Centruroides sculpturatus]|uniref:nuclear speckle splicing regulatory protein 1-like isoform X3 n=1 Tax=Centruroides sculpturatus TaxID=218467 RepID=UPI000C6E8A81|nr:nuclear speckle splicing regulatory protein 1-like isoform X3 [Centruroides sculpturatus]
MAAKKQYGLIIPNKVKKTIEKSSVFDNSDEESLDPEQKVDSWKSKVKKKTRMEIQKVLKEDPTVYEYDSIYDDMKRQEAEKKEIIIKDRKPKYIEGLKKAAQLRRKEYNKRIQKKIQKERQKEGNQFEDKEEFVTNSYKKFLKMQEEEEELEGIVFILKPFKIHFIYIYSSRT